MLGDVNNLIVFISLLTTPSNDLPLHLKQTFPPKILITEVEDDGIKYWLPFKLKSFVLYSKISSANIGPFLKKKYLACIVEVVEVIGKATRSERRKKGFFSRSDKSSLVWNLLVKYIRIRHTFPRFYLSPVHSEVFFATQPNFQR